MSWKLAELRWRQDVGLQESSSERNNKLLYDRKLRTGTICGQKAIGHRRSHTTPLRGGPPDDTSACIEKGPSASPQLYSGGFRPDPETLAFSPMSASSATPLLRFTEARSNVPTQGSSHADIGDTDLVNHNRATQDLQAHTSIHSCVNDALSSQSQLGFSEKNSLSLQG